MDEFRQQVAIKVFDKAAIMARNAGAGGGPAADGGAAAGGAAGAVPNVYQAHQLAQIEKELNALRVCNHPNIVQFYDVLETESRVYLVMEHLAAGELYDHILQQGRLSEQEAARLFGQVVGAIQHCHQRGIVHRDLKPENILLTGSGDLKLVDFGLANYFDVRADFATKSLRTQCGSPHYAAPEILTGQKYSGPLADVWSLGVLLYAMVCGSLPFNARSIPALIKKIVEGRFKLPKFLSPGAQHLIQSILQIAPENRPAIQTILDHPWMRAHQTTGGGAAAGSEAEATAGAGGAKPLSRPEVISPQSYQNARAPHLLQAANAAAAAAQAAARAAARGYHTVNANEPSVVRIDDSDDDSDDDGARSSRRRGAVRRGEDDVAEGDEDAAAAEEEDDEDDDGEDHDDADAVDGCFGAARAIATANAAARKAQRRSGGGDTDGANCSPDALPPSSVLSFQPESDEHLLARAASFTVDASVLPSVSNAGGAISIPASVAASDAAGLMEFAASPAANWGGTLKKVKPVNCARCGKLLSARTNSASGAIVLAGTSVNSSVAVGLHRDAPDPQELCMCAGAVVPSAAQANITLKHPVRVSSDRPDDFAIVAAAASGGAQQSHGPDRYLVSTLRDAPSANGSGGTPGGSLVAGKDAGGGALSPSAAAAAAMSALSEEEIAARETAYRSKVASMFQAAEKGDVDILRALITPAGHATDEAEAGAAAQNGGGHVTPGGPSDTPGNPSAAAPLSLNDPYGFLPLDVRITTIDSWNALHFAARNGHAAVIALLLTCWQPLDINSRTKSGWTPLMLASDKGHLDACQLLLRYGAAIHVTNNDGKSAIFLARESGHPAIAQALTHASSSRHRKHTEGAAARQNTSIHPESGEQRKELNHQLLQAAEGGDIAKVKHLLQLGRNAPSPSSASARSPPSTSSSRSSPPKDAPSADDGLRYCVDIRAKGIDNWSVLHFAARKGRTAVVSLLLEHDPPADVNALTKNNWTPLMLAADRGHLETCRVLLAHGADPTLQSNDKYTALAVAQEGNFADIVAALQLALAAANLPHKQSRSQSQGNRGSDSQSRKHSAAGGVPIAIGGPALSVGPEPGSVSNTPGRPVAMSSSPPPSSSGANGSAHANATGSKAPLVSTPIHSPMAAR